MEHVNRRGDPKRFLTEDELEDLLHTVEWIVDREADRETMLKDTAEEYVADWADMDEDEQSETLEDLAKMYKKAALGYGCTVKGGRLYDRSGQELTRNDTTYWYVNDDFYLEAEAQYSGKEWYAIMRDEEDNDHGDGTYYRDEAIRRLRKIVTDGYPDAYIAVIDPKDDFCLGAIYLDEL